MSSRITAIGSGDAFCSAGRGHTCWLVDDEAGTCAVDLGATALTGLVRLGRDPQEIAAIHFTHLHGDHVAGWPFLLVDAVYRARRTAALAVTGPPGTAERLQTLWAACYADAAAQPLPFPLEVTELRPSEAGEVAGRRVVALRAQHQRPPHVALSLRLEGPAGTIAFTGDTGPHEGLVDLARGAVLLCAECTDLNAAGTSGASPDYPPEAGRRHLAWSDLRTLLPSLGVRRIALAHLGASARAQAGRIEAEARALSLDLVVCDDGTSVDLP